MIKGAKPKRVTLPNGRTFMTRYKRAKRANLPANVHLKLYPLRAAPKGKHHHHQQRVNQQRGQGLGSLLTLAKMWLEIH